jgi:hypothetical protein
VSKLDEGVLNELEELVEFGERVKQTKVSRSSGNMVYMSDCGVNSELAYQWGASCLNLLERVSGADSVHYRSFEVQSQKFRDYSPVSQALGIVRAAKDNLEQEFLFETRLLTEAEVFDDFL